MLGKEAKTWQRSLKRTWLLSESYQAAVTYSMQLDYPRPDAPIQSIDLLNGPESVRGGVPALLAVTAAE